MLEAYERDDIEKVIREYSHVLYRTCFLMLKSKQDAEDVVQETFYKYITVNPKLNDEEHKKAWLLKVSQNKCKNLLRFHRVHPAVSFEEVAQNLVASEKIEITELDEFFKIANLSFKYKSAVILYYIEEYSVEEVAHILGITKSAVKMRLKRAREILKETYEKNFEMEVNVNDF